MSAIGFITSDPLTRAVVSSKNSLLTQDDQLVVDVLEKVSISVLPVGWRQATDMEKLKQFDLLVMRSPWDYMENREAFLGWLRKLQACGIQVVNPLETVLWNIDKHYLGDMAQRGATIPETLYVNASQPLSLTDFMYARSYREIVVKPTISAAAFHTFRLDLPQARAFQKEFEGLVAEADFMIQPFLPEVVEKGEWSLVYFGGAYSHSVLKRAKAGDFRVQDNYDGTVHYEKAPYYLIQQGNSVLERIPKPYCYARVDGIDRNGTLVITELELIEPELFLRASTQAPQRFAEALLQLLGPQAMKSLARLP